MSDQPFTVTLSADLVAKIEAIAAGAGITREEAMQRLLQERLDHQDAFHRIMRRRKRRRLPRGWALGMEIPPPEPEEPPKRRRKDDGPIVVTDDWPEIVPIGEDELRVIEGYMRDELDKLFGPLP